MTTNQVVSTEPINPSDFSVGLMHKLAIAFAKAGISPKEVDELCRKKKSLRRLADDLHGSVVYDVDCAGSPFIPERWEYQEKDQITSAYRGKLSVEDVVLFLEARQNATNGLNGDLLKRALEGKSVLTAHVLDFLMLPENRHLIPEEWKPRVVFFWGSIYRDSGGSLCVRCLSWNGSQWHSGYNWLSDDWSADYSAAVLAS